MARAANAIEADVVVAGSGMGGLVAAVRAQEFGADVVLLEKGTRPGGTTIVSGGVFPEAGHTPEQYEPQIDPFEPVEMGIAWLEELGVTVAEWTEERSEPIRSRRATGLLRQLDPPDFVAHMVDLVEERGGRILLQTPLESLSTDDDGRIDGVIAYDLREEERFTIRTRSVILATGGFSGNEELVEQFFPESRNATFWHRRDPWTTGDGFLAAKDVGAKTTGGLSIPYGRSLIAPPAVVSFDELREATQYYGAKSITLDADGRRFTDESKGRRELNEDLIRYSDGRAFHVVDRTIYDSSWPLDHVGTRIERSKEFGGLVLEADTIADLCAQLSDHDVDGDRALETIESFNEAIRDGRADDLDPPRRRFHDPIETPTFYAIRAQAGVSFYFGGLDVNECAQVLSRARSSTSALVYPNSPMDVSYEPIPGLYAAGVEVGRPDDSGYYQHGLAIGLATGRLAGEHAARYATGGRND